MEWLWFLGVGVLGGLARASYGMLKAVARKEEINILYFLITLLVSGLIGGLLGYIFDVDFRIAALAGYVGTDILENIFKGTVGGEILLKKK